MLGIAPLYPSPWPLARDSRVEFTMRRLGLATLEGSFERMSGTILADQSHTIRRLEFAVDAGSLTTHSPERDARLRALGLFGSDAHPTLGFRSNWTYEKGGGRQAVQGMLTMHGTGHVVELIAEPARLTLDVTGRRWYDARVSGAIDRRAWGVAAHPSLGHDVHVRLHIRAAVPGVKTGEPA